MIQKHLDKAYKRHKLNQKKQYKGRGHEVSNSVDYNIYRYCKGSLKCDEPKSSAKSSFKLRKHYGRTLWIP